MFKSKKKKEAEAEVVRTAEQLVAADQKAKPKQEWEKDVGENPSGEKQEPEPAPQPATEPEQTNQAKIIGVEIDGNDNFITKIISNYKIGDAGEII